MDGLIAAHAALRNQNSLENAYIFTGGVILSSPFFGVAPEADIGSQYKIVETSLRFLYITKITMCSTK